MNGVFDDPQIGRFRLLHVPFVVLYVPLESHGTTTTAGAPHWTNPSSFPNAKCPLLLVTSERGGCLTTNIVTAYDALTLNSEIVEFVGEISHGRLIGNYPQNLISPSPIPRRARELRVVKSRSAIHLYGTTYGTAAIVVGQQQQIENG